MCDSRCLAFHCDDGERGADRRRGEAVEASRGDEAARALISSLSLSFSLPFTPSRYIPWLDPRSAELKQLPRNPDF